VRLHELDQFQSGLVLDAGAEASPGSVAVTITRSWLMPRSRFLMPMTDVAS